jgi:hypothetical protein
VFFAIFFDYLAGFGVVWWTKVFSMSIFQGFY